MSESTLAVIPARGGSKRVPRKNVREIGGQPLISYTIQQAENAEEIDRAIISTDDEEIAQIAREHGGEVPFLRPADLATDTASLSGTIKHAIEWMSREEHEHTRVCSLQVTSPLRSARDIDKAIRKLERTEAESCISISKYVTAPQWAVSGDKNGYLQEYFDFGTLWGDEHTRSQDIPELFHPNGAIFVATIEAWKQNESFYSSRTVGYEMPPERSFDIDEPWELELVRELITQPQQD